MDSVLPSFQLEILLSNSSWHNLLENSHVSTNYQWLTLKRTMSPSNPLPSASMLLFYPRLKLGHLCRRSVIHSLWSSQLGTFAQFSFFALVRDQTYERSRRKHTHTRTPHQSHISSSLLFSPPSGVQCTVHKCHAAAATAQYTMCVPWLRWERERNLS